ncbi:hypothetical protein Tco_1260912 [Tanacetum coccineum]
MTNQSSDFEIFYPEERIKELELRTQRRNNFEDELFRNSEEAWETIENFAQGQKEWDNPPNSSNLRNKKFEFMQKDYLDNEYVLVKRDLGPGCGVSPNIISEQEIENLKVHAKRLFGNENVWIEMHRNIAWDKVENPNPQSTPQVPPSFEESTPPVTHSEEVEKTLGTPIEVEPLNKTKLEEVGLNCNHNTLLSSREVLILDKPEPQPLLNSPSLDVSLGDVIGPEPPIKPHSPDSSRMKVVDYLTTQTPSSPHLENSHPKGAYSYYNPGIDDPKRHYEFKPGLLGKSVSLCIDISNWEMFDDDWRLESKEVSPLGEELSLFDRPNEVERGRIPEAHRLESILQQQISQRMAPSRYYDVYRYYHPQLNSSVGEPSPLSVK